MFDWWSGLPWPMRMGVAAFFLLISTILWFTGRFWPWSWALGIILLMFSFPNDAERKGYHDF